MDPEPERYTRREFAKKSLLAAAARESQESGRRIALTTALRWPLVA